MALLVGLLSDQPEIEVLDGIRHRKMTPKRIHGRIQAFFTRQLEDQGGSLGETVPEWRCSVGKADGTDSLFVPDVAWVSDLRMAELSDDDAEQPPFAPDVVIEVRSPDDDLKYLRHKIQRYLANGALLALDVDPRHRLVHVHTAAGCRTLREGDHFADEAVPWFGFDVSAIFAAADRHR